MSELEQEEAQETANISVEEEVTEDVSDSSSDEQSQGLNFEEMSREELEEFARNEREAKQRAIESVRNQAKKRREGEVLSETQDQEPVEDEDDSSEFYEEDDLRRIAREEAQRTLQQTTMNQYAAGWQDWVYDQSWGKVFAPETEGSDKLFAQFKIERDHRLQSAVINSKEDYQRVLRLAASTVLGSEEPLVQSGRSTVNPEEQYQKSMAGGPGNFSGTPSKKRITERQRKIALNFGHDPEEVYN